MGYLVNPTPTSQEEVAQTITPTYLTGTTTSFTISSALSSTILQNTYAQLIQATSDPNTYYFVPDYITEQASHPLLPVLEKSISDIQKILDNKETIVL